MPDEADVVAWMSWATGVECVETEVGPEGWPEVWSWSCGWRNDSSDCAVSLAVVSTGDEFVTQASNAIKTLLWHRKTPVEVFVATNGASMDFWKTTARSLIVPGLKIRVHDVKAVENNPVLAIPCSHYSCPANLMLALLHELFVDAKRVILIPADFTILGDYVRPYQVFEQFTNSTLMAAAEQSTHWYDHPAHVWGPPAGSNGMQTPQVLDLERMRQANFTDIMLDAYHQTARSTGQAVLDLADMDLFNNVGVVYPDLILITTSLRIINLEYCATEMNPSKIAQQVGYDELTEVTAIHWNCKGLTKELGADIRAVHKAISSLHPFWLAQHGRHLQCISSVLDTYEEV